MKYFCLLFIFGCCFNATCFSQRVAGDTLYLSRIPENGILLDKGWKFHPGDDTDWSKTDFDDSNWEAIDPQKDIYNLPQVINAEPTWQGTGLGAEFSL